MQAKVWNDNKYPFSQEFKGQKISIPAGEYVEMEFYEAKEFEGRYSPIKVDGGGQPKPESYKMIRVEAEGKAGPAQAGGFPCAACGKVYESQRVLDAHVDEQHLDAMADQEVAQKRRAKKEA